MSRSLIWLPSVKTVQLVLVFSACGAWVVGGIVADGSTSVDSGLGVEPLAHPAKDKSEITVKIEHTNNFLFIKVQLFRFLFCHLIIYLKGFPLLSIIADKTAAGSKPEIILTILGHSLDIAAGWNIAQLIEELPASAIVFAHK